MKSSNGSNHLMVWFAHEQDCLALYAAPFRVSEHQHQYYFLGGECLRTKIEEPQGGTLEGGGC